MDDDAVLMGEVDMLNRVEKLLEYVARHSASTADAGLLLCCTLHGLIILIERRQNDTMTLNEMSMLFMRLRKEELERGAR